MELKQRVIGLVVLLALGVILLPLIFDSETVLRSDSTTGPQVALPPPNLLAAAPTAKTDTPATQNGAVVYQAIKPAQIQLSAEKVLDHSNQQHYDENDDDLASADDDHDQAVEDEDFGTSKSAAENEPSTTNASLKSAQAKDTAEQTTLNKIAVAKPSTTTPDEKLSVANSSKTTKTESVTHKSDSADMLTPLVWAIQLGVFSEVSNANKLVADLKSKGFNAFAERDELRKNIHRVLIGPELDRVVAEKTVAKLDAQLHIKSIIVRYRR